jgi:hypothetical protein
MLIFLLIVIGSVLYITLPFFKKTISGGEIEVENSRIVDLYAYRDNLLSDIKDLEFDREMGKISNEDFTEISERYRREAIGVLKDIDSLERNDGVEQKIEEELSTLPKQQKGREVVFCSACGAKIELQDHFCSQCGKQLLHDS